MHPESTLEGELEAAMELTADEAGPTEESEAPVEENVREEKREAMEEPGELASELEADDVGLEGGDKAEEESISDESEEPDAEDAREESEEPEAEGEELEDKLEDGRGVERRARRAFTRPYPESTSNPGGPTSSAPRRIALRTCSAENSG